MEVTVRPWGPEATRGLFSAVRSPEGTSQAGGAAQGFHFSVCRGSWGLWGGSRPAPRTSPRGSWKLQSSVPSCLVAGCLWLKNRGAQAGPRSPGASVNTTGTAGGFREHVCARVCMCVCVCARVCVFGNLQWAEFGIWGVQICGERVGGRGDPSIETQRKRDPGRREKYRQTYGQREGGNLRGAWPRATGAEPWAGGPPSGAEPEQLGVASAGRRGQLSAQVVARAPLPARGARASR